MSNEPISGFPGVTNANLADLIPAVQAGITSKETLQQIFTLFLANTVLINAGNPNGAVAGTKTQLCFDTSNLVLYICTTSGSISTAVWTLAGSVKFPIPLNQGGTNASLTASNGGIFYSTASAGAILSGTATANQALLSGSSTTPSWSTATYPATTTINQLLYSSASNVIAGLATANSATLVTNSSGVPALTSSLTNGQVIIGSTGATPTPATLTAGTGITITNGAASITVANTLTTAASTYTPTLTNVANLTGSTVYQAQYMRVGNTVTVSGKVDVHPTAATTTQLGISLPIASTIGANENCSGTAFASGIAGQGAAILGDATNHRAQMQWVAVDTSNQSMYYTFTYLII